MLINVESQRAKEEGWMEYSWQGAMNKMSGLPIDI